MIELFQMHELLLQQVIWSYFGFLLRSFKAERLLFLMKMCSKRPPVVGPVTDST